MGLDIVVFRLLEEVAQPDDIEDPPDDIRSFGDAIAANDDWSPEQAEGIDPDAWYRVEELYAVKAGSYGGYNDWLEVLAKFADSRSRSKPPFQEFVNFSDCYGVIGTSVSRRSLAPGLQPGPGQRGGDVCLTPAGIRIGGSPCTASS